MVHRAPSTFTATDRTLHAEKRKILSRGFSTSALQGHGKTILTHVRRLADQVAPGASSSSGWSVAQDMAEWSRYDCPFINLRIWHKPVWTASYLAIDVVVDVIFGQEYNLIEKSDNRVLVKSIEDCNVRTGVLFQARMLKSRLIDRYLFSASIASRKKLIHFINFLLDARMKESAMTRNDVFSNFLIKDPETNKGPSMAELGSEATTLLMAGKCTET